MENVVSLHPNDPSITGVVLAVLPRKSLIFLGIHLGKTFTVKLIEIFAEVFN